MPTYDYFCSKCKKTIEIIHSILEDNPQLCKKCSTILERKISGGMMAITTGINGTIEGNRDKDNKIKVKDIERAERKRKKMFGSDAGNMPEKNDPKHVIKRGKALGGQQMEIDKTEFIKAAAKDDLMVHKSIEAIKKNEQSKQ